MADSVPIIEVHVTTGIGGKQPMRHVIHYLNLKGDELLSLNPETSYVVQERVSRIG